ncbi:hypothetical protein [Haloplanus salilacus]|uniref:hypothetical protein n=1 Tax=Haloplanus salilacus TaxID=2949994 RepID=UPI0030D37628
MDADRTRLTGAVYAAFGAAVLADSALDLASSVTLLPAATAVLGLWIVVAAVASLVDADATVFGVEVGVGEQATWLLLLLTLGTAFLLVGVALRVWALL